MTHLLTHLPYRPWCKHCVGGKGQQSQHKRQPKGRNLTQLDYLFRKELDDKQQTTILTATDAETTLAMASLVLNKGTTRNGLAES